MKKSPRIGKMTLPHTHPPREEHKALQTLLGSQDHLRMNDGNWEWGLSHYWEFANTIWMFSNEYTVPFPQNAYRCFFSEMNQWSRMDWDGDTHTHIKRKFILFILKTSQCLVYNQHKCGMCFWPIMKWEARGQKDLLKIYKHYHLNTPAGQTPPLGFSAPCPASLDTLAYGILIAEWLKPWISYSKLNSNYPH